MKARIYGILIFPFLLYGMHNDVRIAIAAACNERVPLLHNQLSPLHQEKSSQEEKFYHDVCQKLRKMRTGNNLKGILPALKNQLPKGSIAWILCAFQTLLQEDDAAFVVQKIAQALRVGTKTYKDLENYLPFSQSKYAEHNKRLLLTYLNKELLFQERNEFRDAIQASNLGDFRTLRHDMMSRVFSEQLPLPAGVFLTLDLTYTFQHCCRSYRCNRVQLSNAAFNFLEASHLDPETHAILNTKLPLLNAFFKDLRSITQEKTSQKNRIFYFKLATSSLIGATSMASIIIYNNYTPLSFCSIFPSLTLGLSPLFCYLLNPKEIEYLIIKEELHSLSRLLEHLTKKYTTHSTP